MVSGQRCPPPAHRTDATRCRPNCPPARRRPASRRPRAPQPSPPSTTSRQEGQALLDQVERIRHLIRADRDSAAALLADVEPSEATKLVRAFTTYFHLANVTEQVHRGRELAGIRARDGSWLSQAVDRIEAAEIPRAEVEAEVRRLAVRPVFTAHPTEAARRTVLYKLRQIAELLDGTDPRVTARLEETVDLLWQTDELRVASPDVVDEARNAVYYLDGLHAGRGAGGARRAPRRAGPARPRAGAGRAAAHVRHLDRRRPRREPERGTGRHRPGARPPARARPARRDRDRRRAAPRSVVVGRDRGRDP